MRVLCLVLIVASAASALFLFGCRNDASNVEGIIERNTQAMGGRAAIEAIRAIEFNLHIVDPGFEVDGTYRAARPGRMRIDVQANGKHVFTEAFDGINGWEWSEKDGAKPASPKGTVALRHGVELPGHIFGLHELEKHGHRVELAGREKIEGIDYYALRLTLNDGYVTTLYVDPQSWLIMRRRDVRPLHVDIDPRPTTIEQRSWDFRRISGVQFAFAGSEIDLKTGKVLESSQIKSVKINPPLDETIFAKP